jgi:exodeoxyribonuclease VIII
MKPEPGVYPGTPMEEYGRWDAANYSTLKHFKRSPAHAREALTNPPDQTPAMALGSAVHSAVLEPDLFIEQFAAAPICDKRTKAGKKTWADFCNANDDKEILKADEYDRCMKMSKSAGRNPIIEEMIKEMGCTELSFVWVDEDTGVLCKGRVDRYARLWGNSVVADLKTTEVATEDSWKREVVKYQYHAQAAFYLDGLECLSPVEGRKFLWLAIEKASPFAVAIFEPDAATIQKGRAMYRNYLRQWAACQETRVWPGYSAAIQPLMLPDWALRWEEGEDE